MIAQASKIRIRLKSYDKSLLEQWVRQIVETAIKTGAKIVGPVPLPTRIHRYTVLRSPHVDKKSREQFELRIYKRFLDICDPIKNIFDALMNLDLSAGVDADVKIANL